jgi:hypothetical protein
VEYEMSSQTHAILAVDALWNAGHTDAAHVPRGSAIREHLITVPTPGSRTALEVLQIIRNIDPDAEPLR